MPTAEQILAVKKLLDEAPVPQRNRYYYDPEAGKVYPSELEMKITSEPENTDTHLLPHGFAWTERGSLRYRGFQVWPQGEHISRDASVNVAVTALMRMADEL